MGLDKPQNSFGLCFGPNGPFSTHFEPFSMIWPRTDLVNPTWTSMTRPGTAPWSGLDPSQRLRNSLGMLLDPVSGQTDSSRPISGQIGVWPETMSEDRCLLLRQDRCLSSSHLSCLNSRHLSCLNRRHLSRLNRRRDSCRPPAGCCDVFC